jgi:hypothetical protein
MKIIFRYTQLQRSKYKVKSLEKALNGLVNPMSHYKNKRHMFLSSDYKYIYHISIIDYLQNYNWDKKTENFLKTILRGSAAEISAVNPNRYAKRFIEFMKNVVIQPDFDTHKKYSGNQKESGKINLLRSVKRLSLSRLVRSKSEGSITSDENWIETGRNRKTIK